MTDSIIAAGSILVSLATLFITYLVKRDQTALIASQAQLKLTQDALAVSQASLTAANEALHKEINSRMTELLELTRKDSKAEGKLEQRQEDKKIF